MPRKVKDREYKLHAWKAGYKTLCGRPKIEVEWVEYVPGVIVAEDKDRGPVTCKTCVEWMGDIETGLKARMERPE